MAGVYSKSGQESQAQLMTCCLGDHRLQSPKLLPCQHSFCAGCIKAKVGQGRKQFMCPKCQLSISLKEKEVDQLPDNFLYHTLKEKENKYSQCVICKFDDKKTPGTFQCLDCADVLCDDCKMCHTKTSQTRLHKLVLVKDIQSGKFKSELQAAKQQSCKTHSEPNSPMMLKFYCVECRCLACQVCDLTEHQPRGHTCKTIQDMYDEKSKSLTDHVTKMLEFKLLDEEFVTVLDEGQGRSKKLQETLENDVHQRAALIIDVIEKVKQDKLAEVKGHFQTEQTTIQTRLDETKNRMIRTDSIVSYTQAFLEHSAKSEFLINEKEIMKKIINQMQQKNNRSLQVKSLELAEPDMEQMETKVSKVFGKIKKSDMSVKKKEQHTGMSASSTQKSLEGSAKSELFQHENKIILNQIQQKHNKSSQTESLEKAEPQIQQGRQLAAIAKDVRKHKAQNLKFESTEKSESQRQLMKDPEVIFCEDSGSRNLKGLTVTENDDIVAIDETNIQIFSSEGKPKEDISYRQIQNAVRVVAKGDTLYALVVTNTRNPSVLLVDLKGNVKKTITISLPHFLQLKHSDIAVDHEGTVYVSHPYSNTIYKCEPDETELKIFMQKDTHPDLSRPQYLSVTPGGDLVVSNLGSRTIQVYNSKGQFLWLHHCHHNVGDVCCDKEGYIYCDANKQHIQVIKDGQLIGRVNLKDSPKCSTLRSKAVEVVDSLEYLALDNYDNIVCTFVRNELKRDTYGGYSTYYEVKVNTQLTKIKIWE